MDTYTYIPPRRMLFNSHLVYDETQALEVREEFYLYYVRAITDFMSPAFMRDIIFSTYFKSEELIETCRKKCTIPQFVKDDIRSGNAKLVIDYSTEGYWDIDWKFLEAIFGVNEDSMIWLTSLYNFSDVTNKDEPHKSVSIATTSAEVKYNPLWERMVFGMIPTNFEGIKRQLTLIESSQARPSKSMLYNRRPHLHRIALLSKMKYHNELNRMIWSWGGILCDDDEIITNARKQKEIKNVGYDSGVFLDEKYKEIFEEILRTPLHSDNEDITTNKAGDMNFRHVHQTYFQVLTETLFQQPGIFLSEKSYKPFLSCQPFVLCGQTGTVNVLREQGYDVYDDWIDHSYDTILDDTERLDALSMEVRRLNQITDDDWVDMLKEMLPTIKKNLLHLVDSGDKVDVITFDHSVSDTPMPVFDL